MFESLRSALSQATASFNAEGELLIRSALSRYILWIIVGLLAAVVARLLWRKRVLRPFSVGSYGLAIVVLMVVVPGFVTEAIRVSPTRISWHGGFWFYPNSKEVSLMEIKSIQEFRVAERPPKSSRIFWNFRYHDGTHRVESFGDLFAVNRQSVIDYLRRHGLEITSENAR